MKPIATPRLTFGPKIENTFLQTRFFQLNLYNIEYDVSFRWQNLWPQSFDHKVIMLYEKSYEMT